MHPSTAPAADLAAAGLDVVRARILRGVAHDLNNACSVLIAIRETAAKRGSAEALRGHLEQEIDRLEGAARSLDDLAGDVDAEPEPLDPVALTRLAAGLLGVGRIRVEIEADDDLPPVRAGRARLLGVLLAACGGIAGEDGPASVGVRGRGGRTVTLEVRGGAPPPSPGAREALGRVLARDGGACLPAGDHALTLELPALGGRAPDADVAHDAFLR